MNHDKRNAAFAGWMLLLAMAASLTGGMLIQGIIDKPDFMQVLASARNTLITGVILELVNAFAVIGIAAALWTPFKRHGAIGVGYLSIRIMEATACAPAAFIPITLATLAGQSGHVLPFANMLVVIRGDIVAYAIPTLFGAGALLLYIMLFRSHMVPKYISLWGLLAAIAVMTNMCVSATALKAVLALPIIVNEIYLGCYLIVKGFREEKAA